MVNQFIQRNPVIVATVLGVIIFVIGFSTIPGFGRVFGLRAMLVLASFLGIAAIGQTMVILVGGIDLSIPALIGLGNVVAAKLYGDGLPFWLVLCIILALAILIGSFNGGLSAYLNIHPLIITLGVGFSVQGAVLFWTQGFPTGNAPQWITQFVSIGGRLGPFPFPGLVFFWLGLSIVIWFLLNKTVFGKQIYALGANPVAAKLTLVKPVKINIIIYAMSSCFASITGVFLLGFTGSALASVGTPYLFLTIGAVVVGGTAMVGGKGGYIGTLIGSFVLIELTTILRGFKFPDPLVSAVLGLVILVLVSIYGRESHVRNLI